MSEALPDDDGKGKKKKKVTFNFSYCALRVAEKIQDNYLLFFLHHIISFVYMFQNFFPHTIFSIFSEESTNPLSSLINLFIQIFILSQVKKTTKKGALDADQESQVNIFPTLHLISTPLQIKILFLVKTSFGKE